MTSLLFITISALVLILMIFWVLRTLTGQESAKVPPGHYKFESASEVAIGETSEFYLGTDNIKLQTTDNDTGLVFWNLSQSKWHEISTQNGLKPDLRSIVLRLTEVGDRVHYTEMWVDTTAGQYRFKMQPMHSYYLTLGIKNRNQFIPILTSKTIMLH